MKKVIWGLVTVALSTTLLLALDIEAQSGNAFNKVMSKNRVNKNIEGSNHVVIKNSDDMEKYGKKDLGITVDGTKTKNTIYNYVEVKNVKIKENNFNENKRTTNKYNVKNEASEGRNIGVKVKTGEGFNRGTKVKVNNTVKIENSELD